MYSPKIRNELIPTIYRRAKEAGVPMTAWVNRLIEKALSENGRSVDNRNAGDPENGSTSLKEL